MSCLPVYLDIYQFLTNLSEMLMTKEIIISWKNSNANLFHSMSVNPCYQINMPKFIVVRDTESHDIFILHFQSTNNFYVLLLEPTSTFLWISIV